MVTATIGEVAREAAGYAALIPLGILLAIPLRYLERFIVAKAYGITREDLRTGRIRLVRDDTGLLTPTVTVTVEQEVTR